MLIHSHHTGPGLVTGLVCPQNHMGTKIYNSDLTKELIVGARIQSSIDPVPSELAEKVIPTMEVNPRLLRRTTFSIGDTVSNATGGTIFTVPADKDTFITGGTFSVIKDVTATSVLSSMTCVSDGITRQLALIPGLSLTVQNQSISFVLANPLKVDRSSTLRVIHSTNVGNISGSACFNGYIIDNINA